MLLDGKQVVVGSPFIVGPKRYPHYVADFRLATRPYALSKQNIATSTRTQFAAAWHAATSTKSAFLRKCTFSLESVQGAGLYMVELHGIISATVTGNPAITIAALKRGGTTSELTALALPTSPGNDIGAATRICGREFNVGATAAAPTTNPPAPLVEVVLWEHNGEGQEPPVLRAGILEGWAVTVDAAPAGIIKCFVRMEFWEE